MYVHFIFIETTKKIYLNSLAEVLAQKRSRRQKFSKPTLCTENRKTPKIGTPNFKCIIINTKNEYNRNVTKQGVQP